MRLVAQLTPLIKFTVTIEAFKAIRGTLSLGSVAFEECPLSIDPAVTRRHRQEYRSSNPLSSTTKSDHGPQGDAENVD
jgi:hypothetical protein